MEELKKFDLVKYKIASWQDYYEIGLYFGKLNDRYKVIKGITENNTIFTIDVLEVFKLDIIKN